MAHTGGAETLVIYVYSFSTRKLIDIQFLSKLVLYRLYVYTFVNQRYTVGITGQFGHIDSFE